MFLHTVYEKIHAETSVQLGSDILVLLKCLAGRRGFNDVLYNFLWYKLLKFNEKSVQICSITSVLKTKVSGKQIALSNSVQSIFNWSSPWAGPYVCSELRACAEGVAYGHLKFHACAKEVAYGHLQWLYTCAGEALYGLSTETTDCSRKSPLYQSKTYTYTCIDIYSCEEFCLVR